MIRHGAIVRYLANDITVGRTFPLIEDEAYIAAKRWKSSSARVADSRGILASGAAFLLADEARTLAIIPSPMAPTRIAGGYLAL